MAKKYWWEDDEQQDNAQQEKGQRYWWDDDSTAADTAGTNITNRVNTWLKNHNTYISNYNKRYSGRKNSYEDAYVSDSSSWLDTVTKQKSAFDAEADSILAYMDRYKGYLDADWMEEVRRTLTEARDAQSQILDITTKDHEWWSGFGAEDLVSQYGSAEDAYKYYQRAQGYNTKYAGATGDEIQQAMETLGPGEEYDWLRAYRGDVYGNTIRANADFQDYTTIGSGLSYTDFGTQTMRRGTSRRQRSTTTIDKYRAASLALAEHYGNEAPLGMYDKYDSQVAIFRTMEDEEFENLAYCIAYDKEHGTNTAEQYVDIMEETLSYRRGNQIGQKITNIDIPVIEGLAALGYGALAGVDSAAFGIDQRLSKDGKEVAYYPSYYANAHIGEQASGFDSYLHSAATNIGNMAPSILVSSVLTGLGAPPKISEAVGSAVMGFSASGNAYKEALMQGYDKETARLYGDLVGASEGVMQYLIGGISKLGGMSSKMAGKISAIDDALLRGAAKFGLSNVSEIVEEELQNFLEPAFRAILFGEDYDAPTISEIVETAIVTFLSTSFLEGGGTYKGIKQDMALDKHFSNEYGAFTGDLIQEGLLSDPSSESYKLAEKFQKQTEGENGKAMTGYQIRQLVEANDAQFAVEDYNSAVKTAKEMLTNLGETKDVDKIAKLAAKRATGQELTRTEKSTLARSQYGAQVAKEMRTASEQTVTYKSLEDRVGTEGRFNVSESGQATIRESKEGFDISKAEVVTVGDGQVTFKTESGTEVYAGDIDFADEDQSYLVSAVSDIENITPAAATAVMHDIVDTSKPLGAQLNGIDEAYTYGYHGYSVADLKAGQYVSSLTDKQMMSAYKLGESARKISDTDADAPRVKMRTAAEAKLSKKEKVAQQKARFESDDVDVYFLSKEDGSISKFDGNTDRFDDKRAATVRATQILSMMQIGGSGYYLYESYENADGVRVYKDANGVEKVAPNGIYTAADGRIYIDLNAGEDGQGVGLYTLSHELGHFVKHMSKKQFKVLGDLVTEAFDKTDLSMHERVVAKQDLLSKVRGERVSYDEAFEEVVCDALSTMISDGNFFEKIAEIKAKDRGLFNTMKRFFKEMFAKFKKVYAKLTPDQKDAQDIREMKDMFDRIQTAFAKALVESSDNFHAAMESVVEAKAEPVGADEIITDGAVVTDGEGERFSIRSMKHDIAEGKMFEDLKNVCGWTDAQVNTLRTQLKDLVEYMIPYRNILDMNESYGAEGRRFSPYKPNSDPLYKISMDFSTLCSKRLLTQYVIEQLQLRENRPMSAEEQMAIRDMLNEYRKVEKGLQVACAMCYVEAARLKSPKQIQRWLDDPAPLLKDYFGKKNKSFNDSVKKAQADFKESKGYDREAPKKDMKPADVKELNQIGPRMRSKYQLSAEEQAIVERAMSLPNSTYLTAGNLANLSETDPVIYDAYTAFVRTATRSKSLEKDEPYYYGDSARDNGNGIIVTDSFIEAVNRENGMRFSSWSDWRIQHLLDYITAVIDNSVRGAAMHGYTKFGDEVRVLGKTGMMFNMSGVAGTQTGLNEDGSLSFSPTESIDVNEAIQLREEFPEHAGLQCIGVSNEHIIALLRSDIIDYVIPYHVSGLNAALRRMVNIHGWADYTGTQHASIDKSIKLENAVDKEHWHEEPVFSEFFVGYDTGMTGIEAMRASAEKYKQMCKDRGLTPKFNQFATEDNYWKLLIDRKMINQKTGNLIRQKAVTPTFDFSTIKGVVDKFVENYDAGLEARALNHIVENWDSIPQRIKDLKKHGSTKTKKTAKAVDTLSNQTLAAQPAKNSDRQNNNRASNGSPLTRRSVKQRSVGSTHEKMSSTAAAEILGIENIAKYSDSVKEAVAVLGEFFTSVDQKKPVLGFKRTISASNLEGSLVSLGILKREGTSGSAYRYDDGHALRVSNHSANANNFVGDGEHLSIALFERGKMNDFVDGKSNVIEAVFRQRYLDGNPEMLKQVIHDIAHFIAEGEYHDTAGAMRYNFSGTEEFKEKARQRMAKDEIARGKKFSERDSSGKQLTKEQQEFFKDSRVRDRDGNLLVMYHGSSSTEKFTVFERRPMVNGKVYGDGYYFTEAKNEAHKWGSGNIYEVYVNLSNPYYVSSKAEAPEAIVAVAREKYGRTYDRMSQNPSWWGSKLTRDEFIEQNSRMWNNSDIALISAVDESGIPDGTEAEYYGEVARRKTELLRSLGYDGVIVETNRSNRNFREVMAFDSNQIKSVDNKNPTGDPDMRFSERTGDSVSNRSLLANAFEGITQNSNEYKQIQKYKGHIKELNELENKLQRLNNEIRKIRFGTTGPRDTARLRQLENEAKEVAKEINRHDMILLNLEASEPLRKVIERERKKEAQKTKDHVKEIQQNKKVRAEQTELRHKIRKAVRDLDKILNRGNKKLNVKEDVQGVVSKALKAADILFTENYGSYDMLRNGIGADLSDAEEALVATCTRMLKDLDKIPTDGYDNWQARQEAENKLRTKMSKLKDVFARERKRLNNTTVSTILGELADAYASLEKSEQSYVQGAYTEAVHNFLKNLQSEVGGTVVQDMTKDQLESVYAAYKMVLTTVRKANELFNQNLKMSREQLGNAVIEEVMKAGGTHGLWTKAEIARSQFDWNNMKPVWVANRIGSESFGKLWQGLFEGQYNFAKDIEEAKQFKLEMDKKYKPRNWDAEKQYNFVSSTGKAFSLNLQQIMSLYAYTKRGKQAIDHLISGGFVYEGNSTVIVDEKGRKKTYIHNGATSYKLNEATLNGIINSLTAEQKAYVDEMQVYLSDVMGAKGNEVSMQLYGIKMFNERFYFPLRSSGAYMERAKEAELKKQQGQINLVNSGFTHSVKPEAKNPIILSGFMDVWAEHCNEMSMYHSMVLPMEDFRKVYNYSTVHDEKFESASVYQTIQDAYGNAATAYIDQLYRELNAGATVDPRETPFKARISKFKKAAVMMSASVVVQQFSAIGRAYALIDPKHFIGAKVNSDTKLSAAEEMKKYAPVAIIKEMGGFDTGTKGSAKSYIMAETYGKGERLQGLKKDEQYRSDLMGYLPAKADEKTWCAIWEAAKRETKAKHPKMDVKSEEFLKLAGERFSEVIEKTQVYDSVLARSANMRSKGAFMAMATAFMAEPTTTVNLIEDALRSGNKKQIARTFGAVGMSIVLNNALASIVYAMRDDDEDETFIEKYFQSFTSGMIDDFNPMSYYPFLKDVYSLFQGYDVERADMSVIADVRDALKKAVSVIGKDTSEMDDAELAEHNKNVSGALMSLLDAGCSMFGVPFKNVRRDAKGIINAFVTASKDLTERDTTWLSFWDKVGAAAKDTIPVFAWTKDKAKADKLYDAIISGDKAYLARLKSAYKTDSAYQSAVRNALKENDTRIHEAAQARYEGRTEEYKRIFREIQKEGKFSFDDIMSAINSKESAIRNRLEPDKVTSQYGAGDFVESIVLGDARTAQAMRDDIIAAHVANGKTTEEAEEAFASAVASGIRDAYSSGLLDEAGAENMLIEYAGKEEEEATSKVGYWAFCEEHPEYKDVFNESNVAKYHEFAEPAGVSVDAYAQFINGTKGLETIRDEWGDEVKSKREQVLEVIDALPLTWQQKDALYLAAGYAESKIWDVPW